MQVNRQRKRRRISAPLLVLSIALIGGLSFGGALLWQRVEEARTPTEISAPARPVQPANGEEGYAQGQGPVPAQVEGAERPPSQQITYTTPPELPEDRQLDFAPGAFAVAWQVRPSEPVEKSYFDDAVFFGDSLSTGLIAHRVVGGAAIFAAIGATPQSALEEQHIFTPQGPVTKLEAAEAKGEREKVYIMLGADSLHLEIEEFISGYRQFVSAVRELFPSAVIYIQSIKPVAAHVGEHHPGISREKVKAFNAAIAEFARTGGLYFLNVFDALADDDGYLPAHASSDGLHLSAEYHFLWLDYLKAHTA